MLKKLIKYDLIWINKFMLIYYSITFIVCLITRISSFYTSSTIGNIIYLILRGVSISAFVSCLINSVIRIWARIEVNLYKDESYLIHTLPVSKNCLYNSKILSGIISILICSFVILLCFIIGFLNKDLILYFKNIFGNNEITLLIIGLIITTIFEFIYMLFCGIAGMFIGHRKNNNRILKSVFTGIILYFIVQGIIISIIYFIGMFDNSLNVLFNNDPITNISVFKELLIIVNILYMIVIFILYSISKKIFKKGVNVI